MKMINRRERKKVKARILVYLRSRNQRRVTLLKFERPKIWTLSHSVRTTERAHAVVDNTRKLPCGF